MKTRTLRRLALAALAAGPLAMGCKPSTPSEAEAKTDIAWLASEGSPESVGALGRLADKNPKALAALQARAATDVNVYIAAWTALLRNADWGARFLHTGLLDPTQADVVASTMKRKDPHLVAFIPDMEAALTRSADNPTVGLPGLLASVGPPAHATLERLLAAKSTRGAMCRGIASPDASADARATLLTVPSTSRDDQRCVDAVISLASSDDASLAWLATAGEPGILSNAGNSDAVSCPRLADLWTKTIASRSGSTYSGLIVPLGNAIKRCAHALDPVVAETIRKDTAARSLAIAAIDPAGNQMADLKATCAAMPAVAKSPTSGTTTARTKALAAEVMARGCKTR